MALQDKAVKRKRKSPANKRVKAKTCRHTLYLREDLNGDFLILTHLKISDLTKRINLLVSEDVAKHRAEIDAFKARKK